MYITEVISRTKELRPNEFDIVEHIDWCNELSADLFLNYVPQFDKIIVNGVCDLILPENVDIQMIEKITVDNHPIAKTDLYDFGNKYLYDENGKTVIKTDDKFSDIEIVYKKPYVPIRYFDKQLSFSNVTSNDFSCDDLSIYVGDTLSLKIGNANYKIYVSGLSDSKFVYSGETLPNGSFCANTAREVMEKTICNSPYDTMYIDFCMMKAALYSGDSYNYKNYWNSFSRKFEEYRGYVLRHKPIRNTKLINWY